MDVDIQRGPQARHSLLTELTRPRSLDECIGQAHIIGKNGFLTQSMKSGVIPSLILSGPPGTGKTTVATLIAQQCQYEFAATNGIDLALSELKEICATIERRNLKRPRHDPVRIVVFIDEIHRFSKTQQDYLLSYVELGLFSFIGATTVEPGLRLCQALLSRCQVVKFERLSHEEMQNVVRRALARQNVQRWKHNQLLPLKFSARCVELISSSGDGDARKAVNLVEIVGLQYWDTTNEAVEVDEDLVHKIIANTGTKRSLMAIDTCLLEKLSDVLNYAFDLREKLIANTNHGRKHSCERKLFRGTVKVSNDLESEHSFPYRLQVSDSSDDERDKPLERVPDLLKKGEPVHISKEEELIQMVKEEELIHISKEEGLIQMAKEEELIQMAKEEGAVHEFLHQRAISICRELLASGVDPLTVIRQVMLVVLRRINSDDLDLIRIMLLVRECRDGRTSEVEQSISMAFQQMGKALLALAIQLRRAKSYCDKSVAVDPFSVTFDEKRENEPCEIHNGGTESSLSTQLPPMNEKSDAISPFPPFSVSYTD